MDWYWKCAIDSVKGILPFQNQLRALKYKLIPYRGDPANERSTIEQGILQVEWVRRARPWEGIVVLEVGTGWQPLIPAVFSLAGAGEVVLADSNRLLTASSFHSALEGLRREKKLLMERLSLTEKQFDQALDWKLEQGLEEGLRRFRMRYLAPCDCRRLDLPAGSVDLVTSRAVMEHIPPGVIQDIFIESFRLLRPGGLTQHIVDNSDHWEFNDKRLSRVNFLRFSNGVFRWTHLNSLDYQNRLRHSQYVDMLRKAGFQIVREEKTVDADSLEALKTLPLDPQFRRFSQEDLAAITTFVLAEKVQSTSAP